jgi:HEAT repeat protein
MQNAPAQPTQRPAPPPLPVIPPEFEAGAIMQLDAAALIRMLEDPAATVFQKAKACTRLAVIGGKDAVPALAPLLSHPQLSNYARFGLEPNPHPSADSALRAALGQLTGRLRAGVATSIGVRRDAKATDALGRLLLNDNDDEVAGAAAAALARIGTPAAAKILEQALGKVRTPLQPVVARACLISAEGLMSSNRTHALEIYGALTEASMPKTVRLAAIRVLSAATSGPAGS